MQKTSHYQRVCESIFGFESRTGHQTIPHEMLVFRGDFVVFMNF